MSRAIFNLMLLIAHFVALFAVALGLGGLILGYGCSAQPTVLLATGFASWLALALTAQASRRETVRS